MKRKKKSIKSQSRLKSKEVFEFISLIGVLLLVYSTTIPYANLSEQMSNVLYFRGIISSGIIITVGLAGLSTNLYAKSVFNSATLGLSALLYFSTKNILCDCVDIHYYYSLTIMVTSITFVTAIIYRRWIYPSTLS